MKLISWNVNGIRATLGKGLPAYLEQSRADVFCFQETKAHPGDLQHVQWPEGYQVWFNPAVKKGYSGTGILSRVAPRSVTFGIGCPDHDQEGRVINAEFDDFFLVNVYVPNAQDGLTRLAYRQAWDRAFLAHLKRLEASKPVVFCGDLNVAHEEIDLARPRENVGNAGFTDEERAGFRALLAAGFIDTFREFEKGPRHYTWWSFRAMSRPRNIGWRIDYFLVSQSLRPRLRAAWIEPSVMGSDHCPVGIELSSASR